MSTAKVGILVAAMVGVLAACGEAVPDAARFAEALAPELSDDAAVESCSAIGNDDMRSECLATVLRERPGLPPETCADVPAPLWAAECWFTVGERRAKKGDRWGALEACGRAESFYDECLYHAWTTELDLAAQAAPDAISALDAARDTIAFWSDLQTIEGTAADQVWGDFWFFAHNAHRPADLAACGRLGDPGERARCEEGTTTFVTRALLGELLAPGRPAGTLDRICRSAEIPSVYLEGLYLPDPQMDAARDRVPPMACDAAAGRPVRRWNPVFRSARSGGQP